MGTERSGKELTWTFLIDAWDALAALEEGVKGLGTAASAAASRHIAIVSHRLKGTSALYGYPLVSSIAAAVERAFETVPAGGEPAGPALDVLRDALPLIHQQLDVIALGGAEDPTGLPAFRKRHAAFSAGEAAPEPARAGLPVPPPPPPEPEPEAPLRPDPGSPFPEAFGETPGGVVSLGGVAGELDAFFRGNPDASFFVPEAEEHLEAVVGALQSPDRRSDPASVVASLFRSFHTLKGAAYTVGCSPIGTISHRVEDLLSLVRSGKFPLEGRVEQVIHRAADVLRVMLPGRSTAAAEVETAYAGILEAVGAAIAAGPGGALEEPPVAVPARELPPAERGRPAEPAQPPAGGSPAPGRAVAFGSTIRVHLDRLEGLLNLASDLIIIRGKLERHVRELEGANAEMSLGRRRLALTIREFAGKHANPHIGSAAGDEADSSDRKGLAGFSDLEFERYDDFNILARSVDELDDDLAESQTGLQTILSSVHSEMETLGAVVRDLRNSVSRVRLVPVGQLFTRFRRLVRQQEREVGKTVQLETKGEDVELDNVILEKLADPMLHLVRNALAHGIESPDDRLRRGKDPVGKVRLAAYARGNKVWIEVGDDGSGMDPAALRRRAVSLGLLTQDEAHRLRDREAVDLIFLPGFSTMGSLTTGAGRGVGLDVVRTDVQRLKGEIDVESRPGHGTTFILKVPLTLIVSQALFVEAGSRKFAFPVSAVETLLSLSPADVKASATREVVRYREEDLPVLRLRPVLGLDGQDPVDEFVGVLVNSAGKRVVVLVDRAVGSEDVVVKSLGAFLENLAHYQGAAISASGELILILDPVGLLALEPPGPVGIREESGLFVRDAALPSVRASGGPPRILLVDDSVSVRKVVARMLESAGFEVRTAVDGADALDRIRDESFSLVITDLEMPRVNGYELIQQLRDRPAWKETPILVLTTRVGERHVKIAQELGATGFLSKPVVEEKLVGVVRRVCQPAGRGT